ncbi:hypothetical protein BCV70DRAFT_204106 [Testicularia cyperi]|uniref:Uncharacterized protein n=1 Tax=Testicularia cyperi TaxID=1882483 RepID=A0A317XYD5_9BASI|nr:hypothetical protein BCV70DRAFT_204106 [Testicularia cyperi]
MKSIRLLILALGYTASAEGYKLGLWTYHTSGQAVNMYCDIPSTDPTDYANLLAAFPTTQFTPGHQAGCDNFFTFVREFDDANSYEAKRPWFYQLCQANRGAPSTG